MLHTSDLGIHNICYTSEMFESSARPHLGTTLRGGDVLKIVRMFVNCADVCHVGALHAFQTFHSVLEFRSPPP